MNPKAFPQVSLMAMQVLSWRSQPCRYPSPWSADSFIAHTQHLDWKGPGARGTPKVQWKCYVVLFYWPQSAYGLQHFEPLEDSVPFSRTSSWCKRQAWMWPMHRELWQERSFQERAVTGILVKLALGIPGHFGQWRIQEETGARTPQLQTWVLRGQATPSNIGLIQFPRAFSNHCKTFWVGM